MWFTRKPVPVEKPVSGYLGVEALLKEADRLRDEGDAPAAAAVYRKALALAPDRVDVKVQLGNMLKDSGLLRDAEAVYREAEAADPTDADVCIQLGHVLKLMGQRPEALRLYRRAASLNPSSWAAAEELAEAGSSWQQQQRFEVHFRAGGAEAVMAVSRQLADMRQTLDRLAATLPDVLAQTAYPVDLYGIFRDAFQIPPPPVGAALRFAVLLLADREPIDGLYAQIAAIRDQTADSWSLTVLGRDPERRRIVESAASGDTRITWTEIEADRTPWVAEWDAARSHEAGWLLLLAQGAVLSRYALAWFAAASRLGAATAFVSDQDESRTDGFALTRSRPIFRQVVDHDTLLDINTFGETIAVEASTYRRAVPDAPEGSVTRARSALLLELSADRTVGHVPFSLVSMRDTPRLSMPEHRLAIAAHLKRRGLDERVAIAKGETGHTTWRPARADTPIVVILTTAGDAHALQACIRSLREMADVPDALRFVVVENVDVGDEHRAILEDLAAKRYLTLLSREGAPNWSACCNRAVQASDAPLLLFAHETLQMTTDGWDRRLRGTLERDDVGVLGARMLYGDDTVQHAGILFGWRDGTVNDGLYEAADAPGPAHRWHVNRATGAVTGQFLATRRDLFAALGGFDAAALPADGSDVDYCLKVREAGLIVAWTPSITLRNHQAKTEDFRLHAERMPPGEIAAKAVLDARWGAAMRADPSLHPVWYPATLPFRLLAAPSTSHVLDHIGRTAGTEPWRVRRASAGSA
ncbi:tetratricopeptide repeat protein [Lichenihabitans psoromatis]|uniref:tetratricopeptide repeat protein n=1 Tax=Lichenihabitans psoromatis TaxID=2528642 RepID=UPI0010385967|nr:tetratricopeptide repeat protein [Lichenihabitans psoromatis]